MVDRNNRIVASVEGDFVGINVSGRLLQVPLGNILRENK